MKFCPKCGAKLLGDFCGECGCNVKELAEQAGVDMHSTPVQARAKKAFTMPAWVGTSLAWLRRYWMPIAACVVMLAVLIPVIVYFSNIFRQGAVEDINLGDTKETVLDELGEPYEKGDYTWVYYSSAYTDIQDEIKELKDEQDAAGDDFMNSDVEDWGDIEDAFDEDMSYESEIDALKEELKVIEYDIITVTFDSKGLVDAVTLELDYCKTQTKTTMRTVEEVLFTPESIGQYTDPAYANQGAKVYYESGEYRMEYIGFEKPEEIDTSKEGIVLVKWKNAWGECSATVTIGTELYKDNIIRGTIGENISYVLTVSENGSLSKLPPMNLTLSGSGTLEGTATQTALRKFAGAVKEVTFADGITEIEGDPFRNFTGMQTLTLNRTGIDCTVIAENVYLVNGIQNKTLQVNSVMTEKESHIITENAKGVVTQPTCVDQGYTTYPCEICTTGHRTEYVDANGIHTPNGAGIVTKPSCVKGGYTTYTCAVCKQGYQDHILGIADIHTPEGAGKVTPPTCKAGYTTYNCAECKQSYRDNYVAAVEQHNLNAERTCTKCGLKSYTRIDASGSQSSSGEYILFGSYPQTEVEDSNLINTLTSKAGALPTSDNFAKWTSYGYYINDSVSNYMWYQDVEHNEKIYRGVYFTSFRPSMQVENSPVGDSFQDDNGYMVETVCWFEFEPIKWKIVDEAGGEATLVCEMLIDSQEYNIDVENGNNYAKSSIRAWLNGCFYETVFNELERDLILLTTVDNTANKLACENTEDYIYLLSLSEIKRDFEILGGYGLKTTDYAQCQGAVTSRSENYNGCGWSWLRDSAYHQDGESVYVVGENGGYYSMNLFVRTTIVGICPVLRIRL